MKRHNGVGGLQQPRRRQPQRWLAGAGDGWAQPIGQAGGSSGRRWRDVGGGRRQGLRLGAGQGQRADALFGGFAPIPAFALQGAAQPPRGLLGVLGVIGQAAQRLLDRQQVLFVVIFTLGLRAVVATNMQRKQAVVIACAV